MPYDSPLGETAEPTQALAVYCSDGRFLRHTLDFLEQRHGLRVVDAIATPGGPARLLDPGGEAFRDVAFLVEAHALRRAVLVQHDGCGYYGRRLGLAGDAAAARQLDDLHAADRLLRDRTPLTRIDLYHLRRRGGEVRFVPRHAAAATPRL